MFSIPLFLELSTGNLQISGNCSASEHVAARRRLVVELVETLGFAEAVSSCREIASSGPRKNIGAGEQEPPRNDMPEQL